MSLTNEGKAALQSAASAALQDFPSQQQLSEVPQEPVRVFLEEARRLLEDAAQNASTWSDQEAGQFAAATGAYAVAYEAAAALNPAAGPTCTDGCSRTRNACIVRECGSGTSWPCFCCVPCNTAWLACLASCVTGGG
ncbi:hypothetical protein [Streptomyces flavalbus]|uniref:Uncharacterized protein n=1 Tax=Streptomyces flavalbus TaxID=2665155 RepID=A0ABW2WIK9_9ACTN